MLRLPMKSMTGYGRGEQTHEGARVLVEVKSVNRKQAEVSLSLPGELDPLEARVREAVNRQIARGRCDVRVRFDLPATALSGRIDRALALAYMTEWRALSRELGLPDPSLSVLVRCPGVIQSGATDFDAERAWPWLEAALRAALSAHDQMRVREGEALAADLTGRVALLRQSLARVREFAPDVLARYRDQLLQRIRAAGLENIAADDERLLKEVVLFADRCDIAEEVARLESHFRQFDDCLKSGEPVGRKLDFLAQEMNREINTIGSKANDARIAAEVVVLKTELERFREQAQNIE
jgi:uncharacterized protein (TIGR00255 family)